MVPELDILDPHSGKKDLVGASYPHLRKGRYGSAMIGIFFVSEAELLADAVADSVGQSFGALRQHGAHYNILGTVCTEKNGRATLQVACL